MPAYIIGTSDHDNFMKTKISKEQSDNYWHSSYIGLYYQHCSFMIGN